MLGRRHYGEKSMPKRLIALGALSSLVSWGALSGAIELDMQDMPYPVQIHLGDLIGLRDKAVDTIKEAQAAADATTTSTTDTRPYANKQQLQAVLGYFTNLRPLCPTDKSDERYRIPITMPDKSISMVCLNMPNAAIQYRGAGASDPTPHEALVIPLTSQPKSLQRALDIGGNIALAPDPAAVCAQIRERLGSYARHVIDVSPVAPAGVKTEIILHMSPGQPNPCDTDAPTTPNQTAPSLQ